MSRKFNFLFKKCRSSYTFYFKNVEVVILLTTSIYSQFKFFPFIVLADSNQLYFKLKLV